MRDSSLRKDVVEPLEAVNERLRLPRDVVESLDVVLMRNSRLPRDVVESLDIVTERLKASKRCC